VRHIHLLHEWHVHLALPCALTVAGSDASGANTGERQGCSRAPESDKARAVGLNFRNFVRRRGRLSVTWQLHG